MRVPDIPQRPWLGQVIPALMHSVGAGDAVAGLELPQARSAIVVMVDGLGWDLLNQYRGHVRHLRGFLSSATVLDTCLPSTTAAALTSFATGKLPGQTRMVGYSVRRGQGVMNLLHFAEGVDVESWQPEETYFSRLSSTDVTPYVVTNPKFVGSGLTRAAFRGANFVGRESLGERFSAASVLATQSPSLTYLYWSDIDHAGHRYGPGSDEWLAELEEFDRELGQFLRKAPKDTLVVLTADHGMIQVEDRVDIASIPQLADGVFLLAGEGRAAHVHAHPGKDMEVRERWADYFGEKAAVVPPAEFPAVFGDGPGNDLLGDAVVFMGGSSVVVDSRTQSAASIAQRGVHGSVSSREVLVPLLQLTGP